MGDFVVKRKRSSNCSLTACGRNSEFGMRNSELSELRSGERGKKPAPDASSKGIDNQGFLKNAEAKYRLNLSSSRNSEFRITN